MALQSNRGLHDRELLGIHNYLSPRPLPNSTTPSPFNSNFQTTPQPSPKPPVRSLSQPSTEMESNIDMATISGPLGSPHLRRQSPPPVRISSPVLRSTSPRLSTGLRVSTSSIQQQEKQQAQQQQQLSDPFVETESLTDAGVTFDLDRFWSWGICFCLMNFDLELGQGN